MITSAPATSEMTAAAKALLTAPTGADSVSVLGEVITIVLSQRQTGGTLTVMEVRSPPGGGMPFLHAHPGAKTLVGLDGAYEVYGETGGDRLVLTVCKGATVHVPSEAPHGYANAGGTPGRLLVIVHNGGRVEAFVREAGTPVRDPEASPMPVGPAALMRLRKVMEAYDIRVFDD
jgi:quercetin dioxygenase-like cupin family protein